jgi:DNA repair protein RadC
VLGTRLTTIPAVLAHVRTESTDNGGAEVALALSLRRGDLVGVDRVGLGECDRVALLPADVLTPVLRHAAEALVLVHTHREETPPSVADHAVTRRLVAASTVVGVELLAHLLVTPSQTYAIHGNRRGRWPRHR